MFREGLYQSYQVEQNFYKKLLAIKNDQVFDIGANVGDKSALFSRLGKNVLAFEPDVHNYKLLKRRFFFDKRIKVFNWALGRKEGSHIFHVIESGSPANTLSDKWKRILENPDENRWSRNVRFESSYNVKVERLESIIRKFGKPSFAKIDVEGFELEVLKGLETAIDIISLEANFPEFREESILCVEVLLKISRDYKFNCIDGNYNFFWNEHLEGNEFIEWMKKTNLRYFEIFCFNSTNQFFQ